MNKKVTMIEIKLSVEEYVNKIWPYLKDIDIITNLKKILHVENSINNSK